MTLAAIASTTEEWIFVIAGCIALAIVGWLNFSSRWRGRVRVLAGMFFAVAGLQVVALAWAYGHWAWQLSHDAIGRFLLPPHSLFFLSHLQTEVTGLAVSWLFALLTWWACRWLFLQRGRGLRLDETDVLLITLGTASVGWPAGFLFWTATFFLSVVAMLVLVLLRKKQVTDRLVITPYIIPAAILILALRPWLLQVTHLGKIGF